MKLRLSFLLIVFLWAGVALGQQADLQKKLAEIEAYATRSGKDWNVPGFAVTIVKDDHVVMARGFGVRELGKPEKVDENTLFAIASNSKAFTAASLAILVDEGKLSWDDHVTDVLPGFALYDPFATREMRVRDLLSHRSGLATFGGDLLWYQTTYPRAEILRRIRYLPPVRSFRSGYGYQNIMFMAAGEIVPHVTGTTWDDFVRQRIFQPLGMTRTTTTIADFPRLGNVASPHNEKDGKLRVVRYSSANGSGGAAAINSSVKDLSQWVRLQLGRGTLEGRQVFSRKASWEMWTPHTIIPLSEAATRFNPTRHFYTYGLGWFLSDYHGRLMVSHGGALDGMLSQTAMLPEENLGVVVLTNSETQLPTVLVNKIFDVFLGVEPRDWSRELLERVKAGEAQAAEEEKQVLASRVPNTKPSLPLSGYAGTYRSELYGDATVAVEGNGLVLKFAPAPNFVGDAKHWHYDTFELRWRDDVSYPFGRGFLTFTLDETGKVDQMKVDVPNPDFDFTEFEFHRVK